MSRDVISAVIRGASGFVKEAEDKLNEAIKAKGEDQKIEFPETAFHLPMIHALMGLKVQTLDELKPVIEHCRQLLPSAPAKSLWLVEDGVAQQINLTDADIQPTGLARYDDTLYIADLGSRVWAFQLPADD